MRHVKNKSLLILFYMGLCMMVLSKASQAESFVYQDRIALSKSLSHYAMGQVYDLRGQTKKALLEYKKSAQFDEASYLIHLRLGMAYAHLNLLSKAIDELKLVNQYNLEELQSHYLLALIYSAKEDYQKVADEYGFILKTFSHTKPQNVEIYGYLGQLYYSQKKYNQAVKQFENIFEIDPDNPDIMYLIGSLYVEVGREEAAIAILEKAIALQPNHGGSLNSLGYIYAQRTQGSLDKAEKLVKQALKISPDNGAYLDTLGWIYYKKQQYTKALETLIKADSLLKDPIIYEHIGDVYYKMNRINEAIKYWELSLKALPGQKEVVRKLNEVRNIQASQ